MYSYNTFGLRSINSETFNRSYNGDRCNYSYPRQNRDVIVTLLRVHNLCLNILGYIPGISTVSGSIRTLTGASLCIATLISGDRKAKTGLIIGPWYNEALTTGIAQAARGILEALLPFGSAINLFLDVEASILNVFSEMMIKVDSDPQIDKEHRWPHPDPHYFFPFNILYLA